MGGPAQDGGQALVRGCSGPALLPINLATNPSPPRLSLIHPDGRAGPQLGFLWSLCQGRLSLTTALVSCVPGRAQAAPPQTALRERMVQATLGEVEPSVICRLTQTPLGRVLSSLWEEKGPQLTWQGICFPAFSRVGSAKSTDNAVGSWSHPTHTGALAPIAPGPGPGLPPPFPDRVPGC